MATLLLECGLGTESSHTQCLHGSGTGLGSIYVERTRLYQQVVWVGPRHVGEDGSACYPIVRTDGEAKGVEMCVGEWCLHGGVDDARGGDLDHRFACAARSSQNERMQDSLSVAGARREA